MRKSVAKTNQIKLIGWLWVVLQIILLIGLVFFPTFGLKYNSPGLKVIGFILIAFGLMIAIIASSNLGNSLTATPVLKTEAQLVTNGLYKFIRHPIYTAVMTIALGILCERFSISTLIIFIITLAFFYLKSGFEEKLLLSRFNDYRSYKEKTGRFIPRWVK